MSTAPLAKKRVIWLVRLKLSVRNTPGGIYRSVPPLLFRCCILYIASLNALVFTVLPSPTPPKSVIEILSFRFGNGTIPEHVASESPKDEEETARCEQRRIKTENRHIVDERDE